MASPTMPAASSWKRLPGAILPVIKSSTSGLGANPAQASSSTYLTGAPRFVRGSQGIPPRPQSDDMMEASPMLAEENDPDQSTKIAIVSQGGGFDDLLSRLNHAKNNTSATIGSTRTISTLKPTEENKLDGKAFLVVIDKDTQPKTKSGRKKDKKSSKPEKKKRVRILELCSHRASTPTLESDLLEDEQPKKKKSKKSSQRSPPEPLQKEKVSSRASGEKSKKRKKSALCSPIMSPPNPEQPVEEEDEELVATSSGPIRISRPINPRVAARAKFINSKKLASSAGNAQAMAEILGIPPPA